MIKADNISKSFRVYQRPRHWIFEKLDGRLRHRELTALSEVSLMVQKHECLGVIGGNGAGKSTLLKVLAGISPPSSGKLSVEGRVSAILELDSGFHPEFTGRENIRIGASVLGLSRAQTAEREPEIIAFAGLAEFIDLPVRTYSTGMYLRLGFALASAVDPDVLLVDEALAVGDEGFRMKCVDRIRRIREAGAATVIVSHDLTLVRALCDRAILLDQGRILAQGKPLDVINRYLQAIYEAAAQEAGTAALPSDRPRRGTGEIQITGVRMIGPDQRPSTVFKTGEAVAVELDYEARQEITAPLFGVNIFRNDGVLAVSTNSEASFFTNRKYFPDDAPGDNPAKIPAGQKGTARFTISRFPLLPGSYELSINVYRGPSGAHVPLDEILGVICFQVHSPDHPDLGLLLCPGAWSIKPGP